VRTSDQFIDQLLSLKFADPDHDIEELCEIWLKATKCEWVWLWIKNEFNDRFELRKHRSASKVLYKPVDTKPTPFLSVAQFSADWQEIVELSSNQFDGWTKTSSCGKKAYKCISHESLKKYQCAKFICIPLGQRGTSSDSNSSLSLTASICIHYLNDSDIGIGHDDLTRLGRLSSFFIENSYRTRNERFLQQLYRIDSEFALAERKNPKTILNEYSLRLLGQLCNIVKAEAATLFYDIDGWGESVDYVGSTHDLISKETGKPLRKSQLKGVSYLKGEGYTGKAFATGKISYSKNESEEQETLKFIESEGKKAFSGRTTVFIPLKLVSSKLGKDELETVGVLRCVGRKKKSPSDFAVDTFDQIDLETLQFFCEQITPVLRSIISRVEREKSISIVKHDLVGPISHLRHIADHLETTQTVTLIDSEEILNRHSEHKNPIKVTRRSYQMKIPFRDLMNMKSFAIAASNLVFQLDPEMASLAVFEPKPTSLERDIIARLKEVMKYDARSKRRMTIAFEGFEKIPPLMVDRGATERVFFNLISNAIKYGDKDSQIMINAFEAVDSFRVTVQNQGPGISERERDLVFDEEYRSVDAAKSPIPGLGLGLYIARKAMERLGGRLELTSLKNPTTFCLYFPLSLRCT
jgi:hypothetical protein